MTIEFDTPQGSYSWRMCRLGLPTASAMRRILTPKKLEPSGPGISTLAAELVAERALMEPLDVDLPGFAERGTMLEDEAVPYYEMQTDTEVKRPGFFFDPESLIGASPDGLTETGGLEVKSLAPANHLKAILTGDCGGYMAQIQTCMLLCGRDTWDMLFYHPSLPSRIITVERDEDYAGRLHIVIAALQNSTDQMEKDLLACGLSFGAWAEHLAALVRGETPADPNAKESVLKNSMWG